MRPLCSISIDLDPLRCYYRIHGLGDAPPDDVVVARAVERFAAIFAARGIAATFFVVAEEIDTATFGESKRAARAAIAEAAACGHEIASHSYSHPYELARLDRERVDDELGRAHDLLAEVAGGTITGFRAPGYDLSPVMVEGLCRLGYTYDSSLFPAPAYYAAKAAIMAAMAASGRKSGAVLTNPRAQLAPADPYRPSPSAPWRRGDAPLMELPVAVTPWLHIPAIGTSLLLAPAALRSRLVAAMARRAHFNFELHALDLIDAEIDGIPAPVIARQPDLRRPLANKRAAFEAVLDDIGERFEVVCLRDAAARFSAS
ncbi:MAG TPA: polysaccharide deacetylase family protein [Kofleriaceae bacterium]|nr:polysaccharide deacetylase family protein [Kofleriaceae bacterium]